MALFAINQPIVTTVPTVTVDNKFAPGKHTFQLVVENKLGVQSDPVKVTMVVAQGMVAPGLISARASRATRQGPVAPTSKQTVETAPIQTESVQKKSISEQPPKAKTPTKKKTRRKPPRDNS